MSHHERSDREERASAPHLRGRATHRIAALFVAPALFVACVPERPLILPALDGANTRITIFESPTETIALASATDGFTPRPLTVTETDRLYLITFDATLAELQLAPGRIELAPSGSMRVLPPARSAMVRDLQEDSDWQALDDAGVAAVLRLAPFDLQGCWMNGGCLTADGRAELCESPCRSSAKPRELEPPRLTPCSNPPGAALVWVEDQHHACEPLVHEASCTVDQVHFFNEVECSAIDDCPAGDWPEVQADAWVRAPGAAVAPGPSYDSVELALDAVPSGGVIALSKGDHRGGFTVNDQRATLIGACSSKTLLIGEPSGPLIRNSTVAFSHLSITITATDALAINVASGTVSISHARLSGGLQGLHIRSQGAAGVRDVVIEGSIAGAGVLGALDIAHSIVDARLAGLACSGPRALIRARNVTVKAQHGIPLGDRCRGDLQGMLFEDPRDGGLSNRALEVQSGTATVSDAIFRDSLRSIELSLGARLHLSRALSVDGTLPAVAVAGASIAIEDMLIRNDGPFSFYGALAFNDPPRVVLDRIAVECPQSPNMVFSGGDDITLRDILLVGRTVALPSFGFAFASDAGGHFNAERIQVIDAGGNGFKVGKGWVGTVRDLDVSGASEVGVQLEDRARMTVDGLSVRSSTGAGINIDIGGSLTATDLRISGVHGFTSSTRGAAILLEAGSDLAVERFELANNDTGVRFERGFGVSVPTGKRQLLERGVIRNNGSAFLIERELELSGLSRGLILESNGVIFGAP